MRIIPAPKGSLVTGAHASTHSLGGTDPIAGGLLSVTYSPTNYTPKNGTGFTSGQLLGHLSGIDSALALATGDKLVAISATDTSPGTLSTKLTSSATTPISFSTINANGNEQLELSVNADALHINFVPTSYAPDITPPSATLTTDLAAHLAGIDRTLLGALTLPPTAPPPTGLGLVVYNPVGGGVTDTGVKFYGNNAGNPTSSPPAPADLYYDTGIGMQMQFDAASNSWLSIETATFAFGRNGATAPGQYYRGINGAVMSDKIGWYAAHNGIVTSVTYTRLATTPATFEIVLSGIVVGSFSTTAAKGEAILNFNFNVGDVIAIRNSLSGSTTDVQGWVKVKWRA